MLCALVNLAGIGGQDVVRAQGGYELMLEAIQGQPGAASDASVLYFAAGGVQNMLSGARQNADEQARAVGARRGRREAAVGAQ